MSGEKITTYFSHIAKIGRQKYSFLPSFIVNVLVCVASEFYAYTIAKNPMIIGEYIIVINVFLIIYFAFRDGFKGGYTAILITIAYYFYIVVTRHYSGNLLTSGIETIGMLCFLYLLLASVIGGLKHLINSLIRREANGRRRLEVIIQQLPVGVIITDHMGIITHSNMRAQEIFGRKIQKEGVVGKGYPFVTSKKSEKRLTYTDAPLATVIKTGQAVVSKEYHFTNTDNKKKIFIHINATPIYNDHGNLIAAASIIVDMTEQKELEQRKNNFMNMASHELRTPLTSAKVFLQLAKKQLNDGNQEKSKAMLHKLDSQLSKFHNLIQELLDTTRMQKGKIELKKEYLYVEELAQEVISDLQVTTDHKLETEWHSRIPVYVDKERIRQVLANLITNAIKFSPPKSKIIVGSVQEDKKLIISVKDFGIGISQKDQAKIFEHFYQVENSTKNSGLGLGLYISSGIIKHHGGKIWVKSHRKKGSIFYFSLPIAKSSSRKFTSRK